MKLTKVRLITKKRQNREIDPVERLLINTHFELIFGIFFALHKIVDILDKLSLGDPRKIGLAFGWTYDVSHFHKRKITCEVEFAEKIADSICKH